MDGSVIDEAVNVGYPLRLLGDQIISELHKLGEIKKYKRESCIHEQRERIQRVIYITIKSKPWITLVNPPNPKLLVTSDSTLEQLKDIHRC